MSSLGVKELFSVAGKTAVVTGGGRGIGFMIARGLVENGCKVYISSRDSGVCESQAKKLSTTGPGQCFAIPQDLGSKEGCDSFVDKLKEKEDHLHILVNNSGCSWGAALEAYPDAAWDKQMALNVKAPFFVTVGCLPLLEAAATEDDPSRVINVGSIAGIRPQLAPTYGYDASKAAVHMLTTKLAGELGEKHITCNAIAPGFFPSKMSKGLLKYSDIETIAGANPMNRVGQAEDISGAVLFLASRAGAWVTGSVIPVDGGMVAKGPSLSKM